MGPQALSANLVPSPAFYGQYFATLTRVLDIQAKWR